MPLTAFSVEKYRSFKRRTRIEVRPLTLVFGYNATGKSALLRMLPLLRDTLKSESVGINMGLEAGRGGSFPQLMSRLTSSPTLAVELEEGDLHARYELLYLADQRRQALVSASRTQAGVTETVDWTTEDMRYELRSPGRSPREITLDVKGLTLTEQAGGATRLHWTPPGAQDLADVQWLDAVRARVQRSERYDGPDDRHLKHDGSNAPLLLARAKLDRRGSFGVTQAFFRDHLHHVLDVQEQGDLFQVVVSPPLGSPDFRLNDLGVLNGSSTISPMSNFAVPLMDTGEGLSQVLPIVLALARAATREGPRLLVLEQPELHLHPARQEALTRWICKLVGKNQGPKVMLETHAENVLLAVMLAVLDGVLTPDDVLIYWVYQEPTGESFAERVTLDELARPQGLWPPEVFHEGSEIARKVNFHRLERLRR
jgi:ABC-type molybdenum transport system ATPase subunit/photorepair protein PhrA